MMAVRGRRRALAVALLALASLAGTTDRAAAGPGALTIGGTVDGSLDGVPFSAAPFSMTAGFPWSGDLFPAAAPVGVFPGRLSVTIGGAGPFVTSLGAEILVILYQPAVFGTYGIEVQYSPSPSTIDNVTEFFSRETYLPATQTELLSDQTSASSFGAFVLPLAGGGTLELDSFDTLSPTASIFVPEPDSLALLGLPLAATGLARRRAGLVLWLRPGRVQA